MTGSTVDSVLPRFRAATDAIGQYARPARLRGQIPTPATRARFYLLHLAPLLIGLSAGWLWCGLRPLLASTLDPSQATVTMLTTVGLMACALGLQMPAHLTGFLLRVGNRWRARKAPVQDSMEQPPNVQSVCQLSLASTAVVAGLGCLVALALMGAFARSHAWLTVHFFWTPLTATAMEWAIFVLFIGWLWMVIGVTVTAWSAAGEAHAGQSVITAPLARLWVGFALAWALHEAWLVHALSGTEQLMLAALPMLAVSILAALLSTETGKGPAPSVTPHVPEMSHSHLRWVGVGLFVWSFALALSLTGWFACHAVGAEKGIRQLPYASLAVLLVPLAAWVASYIPGVRDRPSVSGYATSLWGAGLAAGIVVAMLAVSPQGSSLSGWGQAIVLAIGFGYALARIEAIWIACTSSTASALAQIGSALLPGLALGFIAAGDWIAPVIGPIGLIATGALALISLGGLVQIHAQDPPQRVRRWQFARTLATLAIAILLFPASTRTWSAWAHAHANDHPTVTIFLEPLVVGRHPRICLINVPPSLSIRDPDHTTQLQPRDRASDHSANAASSRIDSFTDMDDAFRRIRLERRTYDLVYQYDPVVFPTDRFAHYSQEWLHRLAGLLSPGGKVVLDVPLAGKSVSTIQVIGTTFEQAVAGQGCWVTTSVDARPVLRLIGGAPPFSEPETCRPLVALTDSATGRSPSHSLQRDGITRTLEQDSHADQLLQWLTDAR